MGCASAKHVATVQNEEEAQKGKNYQNGDVFGDEYRIKPVEEVKYMKNGAEEEQKIAARNQENLEKSASSNVRLKTNKEIPGLVHQPRANMHISESQQEFFRMLDEKIEKIQERRIQRLNSYSQNGLLEVWRCLFTPCLPHGS
uniref:Chromosome 5 C1orf21 homolog n=1 Tax=Equus caballus TaxID=9796 RepID=A0A9L0S539_HORSE